MAKKKMTLEEKLEEALIKDGTYEVPKNWIWSKIKFIGNVKGGKRLPKGKSLLDTKTDYPYIRVSDFDNGTINSDKIKYLDEESYNQIKNYTISSKDIYVSIAGSIGKVGLIPQILNGANLTENAAKISDIVLVSNKYLYFLLSSEMYQREMNEVAIATTQSKLALYKIGDLVIPIPPLKEQQRIVDKIECLFEKLDKAKELIEEARDDFEKRKSAILEKAFRGELTDKVNLNAKEIQFIDDRTEFELFKSRYMLTNLSKIIIDKPRNGYSPKAIDYETSVKTLKLGAITRGKFNPNEFKYIDENIAEDSYLWLKNGDFLIQRANSLEYVGISAIYDMQDNLFIYPDLIMKFRVKEDAYLPQLLWYWINSRYGRWYFINNATGTAGNMPKINQKVVMNLPVPVIPLEEQKEIVKLLDGFFEQESKIEELTALEEQIELIKKSILAKAFRGQLGTNSEDDESAIELLKEILNK